MKGAERGRQPIFLFVALAACLSAPFRCVGDVAEVQCDADGTCTAIADEEGDRVVAAGERRSQQQPPQADDDKASLPDDFVDPCVDKDINCPKWAAEGECRNNPSYMLSSCARSCGTCPPLNPDDAVDEVEGVDCDDLHDLCGKWAQSGECVINPTYMTSACRYSCWTCRNVKMDRAKGVPEELIARKRIYSDMDRGKDQTIRGLDQISEAEREAVLDTVRAMDKYARTNVTDPSASASIDAEARTRCRNDHEMCAEWASKGQCADNVVFMLNTCPLACLSCDLTQRFHRCAGRRHPHAPAAFGEGDIDGMFREIHTWDKYTPEILSFPNPDEERMQDDPWVVRFDEFLTDEEVNRLIELGDGMGWTPSVVDEEETGSGNPTAVAPHRTSQSAQCTVDGPCDKDSLYRGVMERISQLTKVPSENFEPMELLRYAERELYSVHSDYHVHDAWRPAGPRVLTMFLCLSDVEEGGATGFPDLDWLFVKPKKGQALLWSNVLSDDPTKINKLMLHEGLPVVRGTKYGANVWMHLYDWRTQYDRDCV